MLTAIITYLSISAVIVAALWWLAATSPDEHELWPDMRAEPPEWLTGERQQAPQDDAHDDEYTGEWVDIPALLRRQAD